MLIPFVYLCVNVHFFAITFLPLGVIALQAAYWSAAARRLANSIIDLRSTTKKLAFLSFAAPLFFIYEARARVQLYAKVNVRVWSHSLPLSWLLGCMHKELQTYSH